MSHNQKSDCSEPSIAVIGAGITGVATAYSLLRRGCRVTLFDKHPYAAMETSFANGGQLSASNAEVWNSWATVLKGLRWMFKPGAPLLVNPKPSWHKLSWMAEFIAAIPRHEENTVTTVRLAIEARGHLQRMAAEAGIDFDCEERGILHFYENKADFDAAARVSALLAKGGLERHAVTPEDMRRIERPLTVDVRVRGARHEARDEHAATSECPQPVDDQPGRCVLPGKLEAKPSTPELVTADAMSSPGRVVAQVGHAFAVHIILTHRERLQALGEALGAFAERRHHIERQVERRFALAIEAAAGDGGAGAGKRGEGPGRVVGAVAAPGKPQAKPPRAKWSR